LKLGLLVYVRQAMAEAICPLVLFARPWSCQLVSLSTSLDDKQRDSLARLDPKAVCRMQGKRPHADNAQSLQELTF
jgi:hypothetical protein